MNGITEALSQLLRMYAVEQGFEMWGRHFSTVALLYVYLAAAAACLIYVFISLVFGGIVDLFSAEDSGAFPAVAIGLGFFAAVGGLSLFFFEATPVQSLGYGAVGGVGMAVTGLVALSWLARNQSNMIITSSQTLIGYVGTCSIRIKPSQSGQIEVSIGGNRRYLTAYCREEISSGERVRITGVVNSGEVDVERNKEDS